MSRRDFQPFPRLAASLRSEISISFFKCGIKAGCVWTSATSPISQTLLGLCSCTACALHGFGWDDRGVSQERLVPIWTLVDSPPACSLAIEFTRKTCFQPSSSTSASSQPLLLSHSPARGSALLLYFHPALPSCHLPASLAYSSGHRTQPNQLNSLKPSLLQPGLLELQSQRLWEWTRIGKRTNFLS